MPSGLELFVVLAIVFLLFGGKKIPELMKGLGTGIKEFKKAFEKKKRYMPSYYLTEKELAYIYYYLLNLKVQQ